VTQERFPHYTKLAAAGLMALLIAGWMQYIHPAFDGPTHFRLHFCGFLLIVSVLQLMQGRWKWALSGLGVIAVSLALTAPYLPGFGINKPGGSHSDDATLLRVVQMNVRYDNQNTDIAVKILNNARPDILLLQEVTTENSDLLRAFSDSHPHQLYCFKAHVGSVAIISRFPFVSPENNLCLEYVGFARAQIRVGDRILNLASIHSRWPWPRSQPRQLAALRPQMRKLNSPLVLAGDFNSAPWSAAVQNVARLTGTTVTPGLVFTYGTWFDLIRSTIGAVLPIDQIMVSPKIEFLSRQVLADGGSDHFPVLSELVLHR
jgi:endonuclease/exonuclease/phosphatase (EEP) superfamily protein YafD